MFRWQASTKASLPRATPEPLPNDAENISLPVDGLVRCPRLPMILAVWDMA